jgi:hypothetical protein
MSTFPWEISKEVLSDFFSGPYLFSALYRVYKGAYYGQGFQFYGAHPKTDESFKEKFTQLPLEIKQLILNKVWNKGEGFNEVIVKKKTLYLKYQLHFLFSQYGRLKFQTQPLISKSIGVWNGYKFNRETYIFAYSKLNFQTKVFFPDFLSKDPEIPVSVAFELLCI